MKNPRQLIAEALAKNPDLAQQAPVVDPSAQNPFILNEALEAAAQPNRAPMHPIVQALMNHMGLLNMVRNRGNEQVVDPEAQVR